VSAFSAWASHRRPPHRFELFRSVDEDVHPDPWRERLIEAAAALGKSLSCVGDEDQIEIALATDIAASERAEENRPPHAESRQRCHDSLEVCFEPSPAAFARPPVHHLSDRRSVPDRHGARVYGRRGCSAERRADFRNLTSRRPSHSLVVGVVADPVKDGAWLVCDQGDQFPASARGEDQGAREAKMPQIHAFLKVDRWHRPCEPESTMTRHSRLIAGTGNGSRFISYVSRTGWITGALIAAMMMAFAHHASAAPSFGTAGTLKSGTGILSVPSVPDATYVTANTRGTQATVYWSSSTPVLILRKTAAFGSEAPSGGASYKGSEGITTGSQRAA